MKAIALTAIITLVGTQAGWAQGSSSSGGDRAQSWEAYGGLRLLFSESLDFNGGSAIETDDEVGLGFGFGYHLNERLLLGGDITFANVDYDGEVASVDIPGDSVGISGELETFGLSANATWHFLDGPLTPFVSASLGYLWVDTNIAEGPPQLGCWWDPWYGQICDVFVDTKSEDAFTYGLGIGLRWDFAQGWFGRLSYDERWTDIGEANGTPNFGGLRLDVGATF